MRARLQFCNGKPVKKDWYVTPRWSEQLNVFLFILHVCKPTFHGQNNKVDIGACKADIGSTNDAALLSSNCPPIKTQ